MFGRRRHAAPVSASKLTEKQLFDLVHARLASELGANGAWVLARRTPTSGDEIFHEVYAQQLAHEIATDIDLEQAAVTVHATGAPSRGWRLWGRQSDEAETLEDTVVAASAPAVVVEEPSEAPAAPEAEVTPETDVEQTEAVADEAFTEPTFVERTLLEPQHYPITVWAEPEFIDASLVNPVPARRSAVS